MPWTDLPNQAYQTANRMQVADIPAVLLLLVVVVVGIVLALWLGRLAATALRALHVDRAMDVVGGTVMLQKVGVKWRISDVVGWLISVVGGLFVIMLVVDWLQLTQVSLVVADVLRYVPRIIVALALLIIGLLVSNFVYILTLESARAAELVESTLLAALVRGLIMVLVVMAVLVELNVATFLIQVIFVGFIGALALAGGIAFGLAGVDKAKAIIERLVRK